MSMMRRGLRAFFDSGLMGLGPTPLPLAGLALAAGVLAGCGGGGAGGAAASSASEPAAPGGATMSAAAALGELIFHDVSLSASGRQACSSCHVAENGHAAANSLPTQMGAADLDLQGARAVPGLRYLAGNRAFRLGGCRAWGRARVEPAMGCRLGAKRRDTFRYDEHLQRRLHPIAGSTRRAGAIFGARRRCQLVVWLGHTPRRRLAWHRNSPRRGPDPKPDSLLGADSTPSGGFFWDGRADPAYLDLGRCARPAGDLARRTDLCGALKMPSLRNVAQRKSYFHNGRFGTLKEALTLSAARHQPREVVPAARRRHGAGVQRPAAGLARQRQPRRSAVPPYNRQRGEAPALSDAEIDELIAFLATLSDGFTP